jgi:hypothetical protein
MQARIKTVVSMALGALVLVAPAHSWAVSPHGQWFANRSNTPGTTGTNMSLYDTTFCYLSKVGVEDTDSPNEGAICRVFKEGPVWRLTATLGQGSIDAEVQCYAHCYNE